MNLALSVILNELKDLAEDERKFSSDRQILRLRLRMTLLLSCRGPSQLV